MVTGGYGICRDVWWVLFGLEGFGIVAMGQVDICSERFSWRPLCRRLMREINDRQRKEEWKEEKSGEKDYISIEA